MTILTNFLQMLVGVSIFYVWVVRYSNIIEEFKHFGLPDGLRDVVGILKLTFALMLVYGIERSVFAVMGGLGIAFLMGSAFLVHIRAKSPWLKRVPSLVLLVISLYIALANYQFIR